MADSPEVVASFWSDHQSELTAIAQVWLNRMLVKSTNGDAESSVTAFEVFCLSTTNAPGESLRGADELWRLIAAIVMSQRPANDQSKQMTPPPESDQTVDVSSLAAHSGSVVPANLPELMTNELRRLLELLADVDLEVVVLAKLCDATDSALGDEMNYTRRTIQRMLKLIRSIWNSEFEACRASRQ